MKITDNEWDTKEETGKSSNCMYSGMAKAPLRLWSNVEQWKNPARSLTVAIMMELTGEGRACIHRSSF